MVERVEEVIDTIEERLRAELPEMKKIFVEPDSNGDRRGVSAPAKPLPRTPGTRPATAQSARA